MFDDSGCPPEADLCQELRVSRGSLREAVRMLAAPGVVEPRHGSGTHVSPLRPEDLIGSLSLTPQLRPLPGLLELNEIRRVLEAHVAAQAAARTGGASRTYGLLETVRSACTDLDPPARSPAPTWTLRRSAGWSPPARAPWSGPRKGTERYGGTGAAVSGTATRTGGASRTYGLLETVRSACTDLDPPARSPAPTWTLRRSAGWSPPARAPWSGPRKGTERYGGTGASVSASATRTLPRAPRGG